MLELERQVVRYIQPIAPKPLWCWGRYEIVLPLPHSTRFRLYAWHFEREKRRAAYMNGIKKIGCFETALMVAK